LEIIVVVIPYIIDTRIRREERKNYFFNIHRNILFFFRIWYDFFCVFVSLTQH
jgi:hypothetical protein